MKAITALSKLDRITKGHLTALSKELTAPLVDGEVDPLTYYIQLKAAAEIITKTIKDPALKTAVYEAVNKYGPADREKFGVKFGTKGTAGKWDFSGDPKWVGIDYMIIKYSDLKKEHETFLKAAYNSDTEYVNSETGEMIKARDVVKFSPGGQTVVILFPK